MTDKKAFRKHFAAVRASVSDKEQKDRLIAERLLSDERIAAADVILMYASFRSEIDTWTVSEHLTGTGSVTAFPLCHENGAMSFHIVSSPEQLRSGAYGIREPDADLPQPEITQRTVCIVPGLAFTENGGRLGYGGGFYDRFISLHHEICTIALSYEDLITQELPLQQHDIRVNYIITEERTVFCNAEK